MQWVEAGFGNAAGDDILHLNADESSALTGLNMLELHNLHNLTFHIKGNAVSKFICRNHIFILLDLP